MSSFRFVSGAMVALVCSASIAFGQGAANVPETGPKDAKTAIDRFMAEPEPAYQWSLLQTTKHGEVTIYHLELTSQEWQGITWKHALTIFEPANCVVNDQVLLFVSGGDIGERPDLEEQLIAIAIAKRAGGRVALLNQVPNQPLFDDRREDDLITETWLRYLDSGDEHWPLLFPMVKSAVKAMDAVQEFGKQENWPKPVDSFVITGASKRGWTSWLTPVVDERVAATAPLVIDTLNFRKQMKYQQEVWDEFSEQIADYTRKGLITSGDQPESPRRRALMTMMDPWTYRERLELPKLMVNGTNDRYWVVDAASNYYGGLVGHKNVLEIPNAGHGLEGGRDKVVAAIAALFRATARDETLPTITWEFTGSGSDRVLEMTTETPARRAWLWTATSPTNDFRKAKWTRHAVEGDGQHYRIPVPDVSSEQTRQAIFGELQFVDEESASPLTYSLTTIVKTYLPDDEG